ncbi:arylamine N-acetyltransferase family protein [Halobacterium yunchengense]|uniref:arylamine N-acetyltransferase family protein n=1 Tax=Halobacterium yunchengense TaxID=3108497 RepID=UPI00300ABC1B
MDADAYLDRIGVADAAGELDPTHGTLGRLVAAHVAAVPFENLGIVGDPHGGRGGRGVTLDLPALYEKVVRDRRGGFCFELNGLFGWLLAELGFDADRCAARVADEGEFGRPPANHHTAVVHFDRSYLADVGTGTPQVREPVPLDGSVVADAAGVEWRVDPDDTPLSDAVLRLREPGGDWRVRYRFRTEPRPLSFFAATCEFLAHEPDGTFTSGPLVQRSTPDGWVALDADALTRVAGRERTETSVPPADWHAVLADEFGLRL